MKTARCLKALLALTMLVTTIAPARADSYMFRYNQVFETVSETLPDEDGGSGAEDPGLGIGNDITVFFTGAIGYGFSKVIPVATTDVVEWRRESGSLQPGLVLDSETGTISGTAAGSQESRRARLVGYDVGGNLIARADITFRFHDPVGTPQELTLYGHTGKYMYRPIVAAVPVARWEPLVELPAEFTTAGGYLVGTPVKEYATGVAFVGYDYTGREVAFASGDLIVQDGPVFNRIKDRQQHPADGFEFSGRVQHKLGGLKYRLVALDGLPATLGFNTEEGKVKGRITTFNTSLRFQMEATDIDGSSGRSNVFTLSTYAPDVDISRMSDLHATVGTPYAVQLSGTDLSGGRSWAVLAGTLPSGMALDPATGVISGTPAQPEKQDGIVVSVSTSDNGYGETRPFSFTVHPEAAEVSFKGVDVRTGMPFSTDGPIFGTGIVSPYSFAPAEGATINPELTVDYAAATVKGTAAAAGDNSVPFNFMNGNGQEQVVVQRIAVYNDLGIAYDDLLSPSRRVAFSSHPSVAADSIIGDAVYTVESGTLPEGLELDRESGMIFGEATEKGTASGISIRVSDGSGSSAVSNTFSITVGDRPAVAVAATGKTIERFVNNNVRAVAATNAFDGVTFDLVEGALPEGLSFNADGSITGSTTAPEGVYEGFRVLATDGEGYSATSEVFTLQITTPSGLEELAPAMSQADWTVGVPFSIPLPRPANAFGNVTYQLEGLPSGVSVDGSRLVGTVGETGAFPMTMTLSDEAERTVAGSFTLNIREPMTASLSGSSAQVSRFSLLRMATAASFAIPRGSDTTIEAAITNGIEPISYTFSGDLPTGLAYSDGAVSGKPAVEGDSGHMTLTVSDAAGTTVDLAATVRTLSRLPVEVSYDLSKPLSKGKAAALRPTTRNVIGSATYELAGVLPSGLSLNARTGVISGRPSTDGRFAGITVTATDSEGDAWKGSHGPFEIGVSLLGDVSLPRTTFITVRAGESFLKTISPSNVTRPLAFKALDPARIPAGLVIGELDGSLSGTLPEGTYSFPVGVTDDFGRSGSTVVQVTAVGALSIAQPSLTTYSQYSAVSEKLVRSNTVGAARYEVVAGALPEGLVLSASTGLIRGTASVMGTWPGIVIKVVDSTGASAQTPPFTMSVIDRLPLKVANSGYYTVIANGRYKMTLRAENAVGSVAFAVTGSLPDGISFDAAKGVFSGSATVIGDYPVTVSATDAAGGAASASITFVVEINDKPIKLTVTDFVTKVGHPIQTEQPVWSNHVGDTFLWADDVLSQNGLAIDSSTGVISGSATALLDITPNVHITDSSDRVTSVPIRIRVIPETIINAPARIDLAINMEMRNVRITADNSVGTGVWTFDGTLPEGVAFLPTSATFRGTPVEMGSFGGRITHTDSLGEVATADIEIAVANNGTPPGISLTPSSVGYKAGTAYTITPTYTNSKNGDVVTLAPDSAPLPPMMTLVRNSSGEYVLSKEAASDADIAVYRGIKLRVTDIDGLYSDTDPASIIYVSDPRLEYGAVSFATRADSPVSISPPTISKGKPSADVSFEFSGVATTGKNLTIDRKTGSIGGYITGSGTNTVRVTESYDGISIRSTSYTVAFTQENLTLSAEDMSILSGVPYASDMVAFTGGLPSGVFTVEGDLPAGISFDPSRLRFVGTTSDLGSFDIVLRYSDELASISVPLSIHVNQGGEGHTYWRAVYSKTSSIGTGTFYEIDLLDANGGNMMALASISGEAETYDNDDSTAHSFGKGATGPYYLTLTFPMPVKPGFGNVLVGGNVARKMVYEWSDDGRTWTAAATSSISGSTVRDVKTTIP